MLKIRIGGDFFLTSEQLLNLQDPKILFIAGGVGINPLASMISELHDSNFQLDGKRVESVLLYSAKTEEELIFSVITYCMFRVVLSTTTTLILLCLQDFFDSINNTPYFKPYYFITGSKPKENTLLMTKCMHKAVHSKLSYLTKRLFLYLDRRLRQDDIDQTLQSFSSFKPQELSAFLCGPPEMIKTCESTLTNIGVKKIHFENWW